MEPAPKDAESTSLLAGFTDKECKLLAAAYLSSTGVNPEKFDYNLMASLTGNTAGSLKKMLPPLKRRAAEVHPSFGVFLGLAVAAPTTSPTAAKSTTKKRKATNNVTKDVDDVDEPEAEPISAGNKSDGNKPDSKKKKVAAPKKASAKKAAPVKKPRGKKEAKKEDSGAEDNVKDKSGENSADGTDGTDGPGNEVEDDI